MNFLQNIQRWLRSLGQRGAMKQEIDEELRFHIEQRTAENIEAGMSPEVAAREARKRFGNLQSVREECRERRGASFGEAVWQDIRFGLRMLRKNPGFTAVAVLTLALGIGANTAIFTMINAVLFKPIMAREPNQLAALYQQERENPANFRFFSYPNFADIRAGKEVFENVLAFAPGNVGMDDGDLTRHVAATFVSANYFSVLGVAPLHGRGFLPEEERSPVPVAVMSYAFWKRSGGDPAIVGQTIVLNHTTFTVVGVMPEGFTGTMVMASPGFFLPLGVMDSLGAPRDGPVTSTLLDRDAGRLSLVGRLRPGLSFTMVGAPLAILSDRLATAYPTENRHHRLLAARMARLSHSNRPDGGPRQFRPLAGLTIGMSSVLLLIACLNLANMMLARGAARRKEIAVRLAIGAGRRRVLCQLLTEGFLLALLGGAGGMVLAVWATNALALFAGSSFQREFLTFDPMPDARVLAASLGFCALTTIFFALGPAWRLATLDVNADLKEHAAEDAGAKRVGFFALRNLLVIGQVALSLALLVAGGLFARSAARAVEANPGFAFGSNFFAELRAGPAGYKEPEVRELYRRAVEQVGALPGVESVSLGLSMPFGNAHYGRDVRRIGSPAPVNGRPFATVAEGRVVFTQFNVIGNDYFRTLGVPLQRGREFTRAEAESTNAPAVAIVSQLLADTLWPGEDALGQQLQFPRSNSESSERSMEVIGVVPHLKKSLMEKRNDPFLYLPYGQDYRPDILLHVRVAPGVDPAPLMDQTRAELRRLDPRLPVTALNTLRANHEKGSSMGLLRIGERVFGTFGVIALLLAMVGIYGVKAYSVARRTREIGIRIALGAKANDVLNLILREGVRLTAVGLGVGLLLALAAGKLASGFLYDVPPLDPIAFTVAPLLLSLAALIACWLPARRAAKVDPMVALRHE
jgi:predicted permease